MKNSDKLRMMWIDKHLVTVYGPYHCYRKWEVRAYTVAVILFAGLIIWGMR